MNGLCIQTSFGVSDQIGNKMSANPYARGFRELIVYQKARSVAKQVFEMLQSMIDRAESFKGAEYSSVREESVAYGSPEELFVSNLNTEY